MKVLSGLDVLSNNSSLQKKYKGNCALLCNNASVDSNYLPAALRFKKMFGNRFIKLFGPQHGFSTDAQDNMIETDHFIHSYLKIPVYSLYSETRVPTDEMLNGIDHFFVDLQDIGARMYTYIYSLTLLLEKCSNKNIEIIILDRPNPLNGNCMEGNILDTNFSSFIGRHPMPVRHGMTIGEVALMHQKYWTKIKSNVEVIEMEHWNRAMYFEDTKLPWLLPSPNLARVESAYTFPATVVFEGTNLSEGRGTTQPLEIFGHPKIDSYSYYEKHLKTSIKHSKLEGFVVRPITFLPTFHKHMNKVCGGFQIHVTDKTKFKPWRVGQLMLREMFHYLGEDFEWLNPPYEYNYTQMPIDIINGTDLLRHWVESDKSLDALIKFEQFETYHTQFNAIKIYI